MSQGFTLEVTPNLKRAVALLNRAPIKRLPVVLDRILAKLDEHHEKPFTADEEAQLQKALGMNEDDLPLLLETASFMFQQAAYHGAKPNAFAAQLDAVGMDEDKVVAFHKAWKAAGSSVVPRLRERSLYPIQATEINWRLNLQMARANRAKLKTPSAQFEIRTSDKEKEKVRVEFTHDELYAFYNQLEVVQSQLDQLT